MQGLDGGRINIASCSVGAAQFCLDAVCDGPIEPAIFWMRDPGGQLFAAGTGFREPFGMERNIRRNDPFFLRVVIDDFVFYLFVVVY